MEIQVREYNFHPLQKAIKHEHLKMIYQYKANHRLAKLHVVLKPSPPKMLTILSTFSVSLYTGRQMILGMPCEPSERTII